jgi:hypothetical protein
MRSSHPIGGGAIPMAYQAPNHYAGQGGGAYGYHQQNYEQGPQYGQTYAEPQAVPPKYGEGMAQPDDVYQPPPK